MSRRHTIIITTPDRRAQPTAETTSFVGGRPRVPASVELPACGLCGAAQTFFLQVVFPDAHEWAGQTLAIFQCTSCYDDRYLVPLMSREPLLPGQDIPDGVLEEDQTNYRLLVFPTVDGVLRDDYVPRLRFLPIELDAAAGAPKTRSHVGGQPRWIHGDMMRVKGCE